MSDTIRICISMIDHIDTYIRSINIDEIDTYDDFYPFINEEDIILYKDIDKQIIIDYTYGVFFKSNISSKKKDHIFYAILSSYILSIKLLTDCCMYKAYSFCINMLREFDDLSKISDKLIRYTKESNERIVKKIINIEWYILKQNDFFKNNSCSEISYE